MLEDVVGTEVAMVVVAMAVVAMAAQPLAMVAAHMEEVDTGVDMAEDTAEAVDLVRFTRLFRS